ncbi:hypothetical protein [Clostridium sp.]|uniref:hypothetical protein n=1 Tax=Clostridium sp. TaxID=1506 RepID=UPI002FC6C541
MISDKIMKSSNENENFDKMQIALALRNSTLEDGLNCSLLDSNIIDCCNVCNLECICEKLKAIAEEYIHSKTTVINTFSFK